MSTLGDTMASELPAHIADRLAVATEHAQAKVASVRHSPHANPLLQAAHRAASAGQRVAWLQKAASAWAEPLAAVSACRRGCSHCCYIPLAMTDVEARVIGQAIGRRPALPEGAVPTDDAAELGRRLPGTPGAGYDSPCPFLQAGACSIYAHRPLACRAQLNLDEDDLLCRLEPGLNIPVPYADATQLKAFYVLLQPGAVWADVRAFFPPD